jgi:hypothetical protein
MTGAARAPRRRPGRGGRGAGELRYGKADRFEPKEVDAFIREHRRGKGKAGEPSIKGEWELETPSG